MDLNKYELLEKYLKFMNQDVTKVPMKELDFFILNRPEIYALQSDLIDRLSKLKELDIPNYEEISDVGTKFEDKFYYACGYSTALNIVKTILYQD